jgi:glycosyltransferase involved in cell wall biosynthesis
MTAKSVLIVVPVLNDERSLSILIQQLAEQLSGRPQVSMLVVDDGSIPPVDMSRSGGEGLPGQVITLSRNLGHQKAIAIGLAYAAAHQLADIVVVMDADGEDRPSDVPRMIATVETDSELSVAVAKRTKRSERLSFRVLYQLYRLIFLTLTGYRISFGNFSAMRMGAARRLVSMSELWLSFPATVLRSRLPFVELPTERGHRYRDNSQMNLVALVILGFGGVSAFLESALTRMILAAIGLIGCCLAASVIATVLKLVGLATPGWVTTVIGVSLILLLGVAILSFIGLALSILAGSHTVQTPAALYKSFIAQTAKFGPQAPAAARGSFHSESP